MIVNKRQKQIITLIIGAGLVYYYLIYLPKEAKRQRLLQEEMQQRELERQQAELDAQEREQQGEQERLRKLENIKKKKLHWRREREVRSWTENWLAGKKDSLEKVLNQMGGEDEINIFDVAGDYKIHFPPSLWNSLTEEQRTLAKSKGNGELELDEKTRNFRYNQQIEEWEEQVTYNPIRGEPDPDTEKDNNALLYGAGGTGKTSIVRRIAYNSDLYPLIEIKGSSLTPRKEDYENGIDPLNKFIFTLCDIENTLEDDYSFAREENGEVRHILFVDECDNVCTNTALATDYTKLIFLKTCMEGINKSEQSQNLWVFATNYLYLIDPPVYRPGRLSNPLDFSWTLGDFKYYCSEKGIIDQFPSHWIKLNTLNDDDNKWVNKFNTMNFKSDFLPFWDRFIRHPDTLKELVEEIEHNDKGEEIVTKKGIRLGEFLEFFWRLFDSKQLHNFTGKYEKPNKPTVEELIPKITEALDVRLKEIREQLIQVNSQLSLQEQNFTGSFNNNVTRVTEILTEIAKRIE
jgi:ATPase family associated with various cellular activities (AAA)